MPALSAPSRQRILKDVFGFDDFRPGQAAAMARAEPAGEVVRRLWEEAEALLPSA